MKNLLKKLLNRKSSSLIMIVSIMIVNVIGTNPINAEEVTFENQGFINGLGGWETYGTVTLEESDKLIETDEFDWIVGPHNENMAMLIPSGVSSAFNNVANLLGLNDDSKDYITTVFPDITNMASIYKVIHLDEGDEFSMSWNYVATDYDPYNDASFISLSKVGEPTVKPKVNGIYSQVGLLGATVSGTGNYATGDYGSTGWQVTTFEVQSTGNYVLGFSVFNLSDTALSPVLFVEDLPGTTLKNGEPFGAIEEDPDAPEPPAETKVSYSTMVFEEAEANDGTIDSIVTISVEGESFTGSNDLPMSNVTISNVPDGLTASLIKKSDTEIEFKFIGKASNHNEDVDNITIVFADEAFTGGDASIISASTVSNIAIDYAEVPETSINSFVVNDDDEYTTSSDVTIMADVTNADYTMLSESDTFEGAEWVPYQASSMFELSSGDGVKTVYAKFKLTGGEPSVITNDTIVVDTTSPIVDGVEDGAFYTDSVVIDYTGGTGTLNGTAFESGTAISNTGAYHLVVTDEAGNETIVDFGIEDIDGDQYVFYHDADESNEVRHNVDLLAETELGHEITWDVTTGSAVYVTTGGAISYTSDFERDTTGTEINFPQYDDIWVKLVATIHQGSTEIVKEFNLLLKAILPDEEAVANAKASAEIMYADDDSQSSVTKDLTFEADELDGATVTWSSDSDDIISDAGEVTRPEAGEDEKVVIITATISKRDTIVTKEFKLKVRPMYNPFITADNEEDIDDDKVEEAISGAKDSDEEKVIIIVNSPVTPEEEIEVTISKEKIEEIKEENLSVKLEAENVSIEVPISDSLLDQLDNAGSNSRLALVCEQLDPDDEDNEYLLESLGDDSPIQIKEKHVYDFTMKVIEEDNDGNLLGESVVHDFESQEEIKLTIYIGKDEFGGSILLAFYFNPDTEVWEFVQSEEDAENGQAIILTNHLSIYSLMEVSEGGIIEYLVSEVINRIDPAPSLNEILNVIETEEMELNLQKYNKLSLSEKTFVANGILTRRPDEGYDYSGFVETFTKLVKSKSEEDEDEETVETEVIEEELEIKVLSDSSNIVPELVEEFVESDLDTMKRISGVYKLVADSSVESSVVIKYDPELVSDPLALSVYYYDYDKKIWKNLGGVVDSDNNEIVVLVDELMTLALFENQVTYTDIAGHWAEDMIKTLASRGFLEGYQGEFNPELGITRAEIATLLVRIGDVEVETGDSLFTDVNMNEWYSDYVYTARKAGIIKGVSETEFEPDRIVSRQEIVAMFMRLYEKDYPKIEFELSRADTFIDENLIDDYARDYVYLAKELDIVEGRSSSKFAPLDETLRAEAAALIYRYLKTKGEL